MGTARQFGGKPKVWRGTVDNTTGRDIFHAGTSIEIRLSTDVDLRLYFKKEDWVNDENYILILAAESPFQMAIETRELWAKGDVATATVELLVALK